MSDVHRRSTRELLWLGPVGLSCLLLPIAWGVQPPGVAGRWLLAAGALWLLVWWLAWQRRTLNREHAAAAPFPDLGWGTRLTLLRGLLMAALGGFVLLPVSDSWLPALCYGAAALLDRLDGEVARRTRRCSELGAALDTLFDALGLVVAPLVALLLGKLHVSYLLTSAAYYLFVAASRWRLRRGLPLQALAPSALRRTLAGCQMGFVAFALWPPLAAELTRWIGLFFMLPLLGGFLIDWFQVSGRIDLLQPSTARRLTDLHAALEKWALPALRLLLAGTLMVLPDGTAPAALLLVLALAFCLGLLVRTAGIALLVLLAWYFPGGEVAMPVLWSCAGAVALLLLGGGRWCVWRGDDAWLRRTDTGTSPS